jgi:hypothetical protein
MGKFIVVFLLVTLLLAAAVGLQFLLAWGILACLKGLGVIAGYTTAKIWWGTLLLTIMCGVLNSLKSSEKG